MRAVIQRVNNASVQVEGKTVAAIGLGLFVLIAIHKNDTQQDIDYIARKIVNLRVFDSPCDSNPGRRVSLKDKGYEVLCRSQITLYANVKGYKVNFYCAMAPLHSQPIYKTFLETIRRFYSPHKVKDGLFQVHSQVQISNDGPYTLILDSPLSTGQPSY